MGNVEARKRSRALRQIFFTGMLSAFVPCGAVAGDAQKPLIVAPKTIYVQPGAEAQMDISVWPPEAVPLGSSLVISGLPPRMALPRGKFIAPGTWALPLEHASPASLFAPAGTETVTEMTIQLAGPGGDAVTEFRAMLVIEGPGTRAAAPESAGRVAAGPKVAALPPDRGLAETRSEAASAVLPLPLAAAQPRISSEDMGKAMKLMEKGDKSLASGNVAVARLCYQGAADLGWAPAAVALGGTFDPHELAQLNVIGGLQPDARQAKTWYMKAQRLGAAEASVRLQRLGE